MRQKRNCYYPPSRRGKRPQTSLSPNRTRRAPQSMEDRTANHREHLLPNNTQGRSTGTSQHNISQRVVRQPDHHSASITQIQAEMPSSNGFDTSDPTPRSLSHVFGLVSPAGTRDSVSGTAHSRNAEQSTEALDDSLHRVDSAMDGATDVDENQVSPAWLNYEHHGHWSWVSICSQSGLKWVCEVTGRNDFIEMANELTKTWTRRLKTTRSESFQAKSKDLDEATAWKYVQGKHITKLPSTCAF